jgi:hypothetical protein
MQLDYIYNNRKNFTTLMKCIDFFNVILSSKGSLKFSPSGNIDLYILCMAILGGWVLDQLRQVAADFYGDLLNDLPLRVLTSVINPDLVPDPDPHGSAS